jgi:hypothetical protein
LYDAGSGRNEMRSERIEGRTMIVMIRKVVTLFTALLLITSFLAGCAAKKEDIIKCSKCNLSPAELKKQYDEKRD